MKTYKETRKFYKENQLTKRGVIKAFKDNFYCDFDIEIFEDRIIVQTDLHLIFDVEYSDNDDKRDIYSFLIYLANCFDFSYTLEFNQKKELIF